MLRNSSPWLKAASGVVAVMVMSAIPAVQGATVYTTSFENPPFTTGAIAGQDGWAVFGPGISTVENGFALTGSQAVFVDGGTATQSGPYHPNSAGPLIELSANIALFSGTTQGEWQFAATGSNLVGFLGGIDVLPDNSIEAITKGYPVIGTFPKAMTFDRSAWHLVDFVFNVQAQTYAISLDGTSLAKNVPFCGDNLPCTSGATLSYGDAIFDTFGRASSGIVKVPTDSGYMDNFQVSNVATTPEPSSVLFMLTGLAGGIYIRRRR